MPNKIIEKENLHSNSNILFFTQDMVFSNYMKNYLEEYGFKISIETEYDKIFSILTNLYIDVLIVTIFPEKQDDIFTFYDNFENLKDGNVNKNLKILFVSSALPDEKIFKFLENKTGYFLMQYTFPDIWVKKIKSIL